MRRIQCAALGHQLHAFNCDDRFLVHKNTGQVRSMHWRVRALSEGHTCSDPRPAVSFAAGSIGTMRDLAVSTQTLDMHRS